MDISKRIEKGGQYRRRVPSRNYFLLTHALYYLLYSNMANTVYVFVSNDLIYSLIVYTSSRLNIGVSTLLIQNLGIDRRILGRIHLVHLRTTGKLWTTHL